ncbi:acyl-CoA/acyl-ACP dehydrogenase [Desulfosarcina sp. OttesenSCG-928-A07]|nr:acyl-CoA/acyl-ACP dehydrogenase [Desulfosarcina sp. OttesenSCG-928-G17]MDL2328980.1 acyl-CoA/acyl-ACP dehydrogenase [Desulfosarcina sp. OttesenSCG-928-A07]
MDFGFTAEQKMLRDSFRSFFSKECTTDQVLALWADPQGYSEKHWKKMAKLGWIGLAMDEAYGGSGYGFLDLFILFEELGRSQLPSPLFTTILSCMLIDLCGNNDQKQNFLESAINGRCILTMALLGEDGDPDFHSPKIEATIDENGQHRLTGKRWLVPFANSADAILVCADLVGHEGGPTLYCVDTQTEGISCTRVETLYGENSFHVEFDAVKVPESRIIGAIGAASDGVERILSRATILKCAEMVGGAQYVLDETLTHVKARHQFGRPLGVLQTVQHLCADMNTFCVSARLVACQAASRIDQNLSAEKEISIAKAWCGNAYKQMTWIAHQLFGAIGFTEEYFLHLYFKHAKACELQFGDASWHRARLAATMGL